MLRFTTLSFGISGSDFILMAESMHKQSMELMTYFEKEFASKYELPYKRKDHLIRVLDIGSLDINGNNKGIFSPTRYNYLGLDIKEGKNVDIVSDKPYDYPLTSGFLNIIISSQTLEHIPYPWLWAKEIERLLCPNGLVCIIAPHTIREHKYPVDCWRIMPGGMESLLHWAGLAVLEVKKGEIDTIGIARKRT